MDVADVVSSAFDRYVRGNTPAEIRRLVTSHHTYHNITRHLGSYVSPYSKVSLTFYTCCVLQGLIFRRKLSDVCFVMLKYFYIVIFL